ncbi:hypothetical protein ABE41_004480 [Fictibacillus arsenicus]|uniref:Uncharacterized protein n=1 Tax=Fictibacillus arsenicus TaxID=255247 RepID=A0A1B1Z1C0_9BACL|nr:hypothetical protein ABE41_004480 [Fictibacillus arsenicus]
MLLENYVMKYHFYVMKPVFYVICCDIYVIELFFYVIVTLELEIVFLGGITFSWLKIRLQRAFL